MTRIIQSLSEIATDYDVLFCDLWGCVHNGIRAYPEAIAALQAFRAGGGKVCLMTNAPRPAAQVEASFERLGIPRDAWDVIVTSGDAAQDALFAGAVGRKVWHIGPAKDDSFFDPPAQWADAPPIQRVPLDEAEGIVCTGLFDEVNEVPEDYRGRFLLARERGLKLLCANPDVVVDLGSTPGAWSQYVRRRLSLDGAAAGALNGTIVALDILPMEPVEGVQFLQGDFREDEVLAAFENMLNGEAIDLVLSDMAPNKSGVDAVDMPRALYLSELALDFCDRHLRTGGNFLIKLFQGVGFDDYVRELRKRFDKVVIRKPEASRKRSPEVYALAMGKRATPK